MEAALVRQAAQTWVLTAEDGQFMRNDNAQRVAQFDVPAPGSHHVNAAVAREWDVGLIGTWSWAANAAGLRWFLKEVRPLLGKDLKIAVAGRGADDAAQGVHRLGFVPDAQAFMMSPV